MTNDGLFADVRDAFLNALDTDSALTAWLAARNGHKYFCRPADKLVPDLVGLNCPAVIVKPLGSVLTQPTNAWTGALMRFRVTLVSKQKDSDELHDLAWHVTQCLLKEKLASPPFGKEQVYWIGFDPTNITPAHEDQAMDEAGVKWLEAIDAMIYMRFSSQA
jgi:hypothetical protein